MTEQIPTPQAYAERHKKAFREAFDFLNAHFPPMHDADWWEGTTKDAEIASIRCEENKLAVCLLAAVWDYLDHESKLRREDNAETDNQ